jgi:hypothetical protein
MAKSEQSNGGEAKDWPWHVENRKKALKKILTKPKGLL